VGPWSMIGPDVQVAGGTSIGPHTVIHGPTRIGPNNRIYQFNSIGDAPQDKKYRGEHTRLEIGADNVIREYCTINRGTKLGGGVTRIGDRNWVMAYVHVAHDCQIGSHTVLANGTTLAGHVTVGDHVTLGAFTIVHQFCAIGAHSFSAMGTVILKDVPPYVTVAGNSAEAHGINAEGLRRRGFSGESILALRRAYKLIYKQRLTVEQAVGRLEELVVECAEVAPLVDFLKRSRRGIVR
jgi:UDP-N-acetylglucosamine acyltransferase